MLAVNILFTFETNKKIMIIIITFSTKRIREKLENGNGSSNRVERVKFMIRYFKIHSGIKDKIVNLHLQSRGRFATPSL